MKSRKRTQYKKRLSGARKTRTRMQNARKKSAAGGGTRHRRKAATRRSHSYH